MDLRHPAKRCRTHRLESSHPKVRVDRLLAFLHSAWDFTALVIQNDWHQPGLNSELSTSFVGSLRCHQVVDDVQQRFGS